MSQSALKLCLHFGMKLTVYLGLALQVLALYVQALRIFQTNENGWAALYFRTLSNLLRANGHDIFAMAPAQNHPGSGKVLSLMCRRIGLD